METSRTAKPGKPTGFVAGSYYGGKFIGPDKGSFRFKCMNRTPKMVTLYGKGFSPKDGSRKVLKRFHVFKNYRGVEYVWPFGEDGLAPSLSAEMINLGKG